MCTQPSLTSLAEIGDMLPFTCSFEYRGRWAPTIKWFDTDHETIIASNNTGTVNRSVIHAITVPVTANMHGKTIRARVFFEGPLIPPPFSPRPLNHTMYRCSEATNLPDYNHEFVSEALMVACK